MSASRFSSIIHNFIFNNNPSQWNVPGANNKLQQFQSLFKKTEIISSGARFPYSTNMIYIAGIMVSSIGYGSIIADNQPDQKFNPEETAAEIIDLAALKQLGMDEACMKIQIANLTERNINDFGLAQLIKLLCKKKRFVQCC